VYSSTMRLSSWTSPRRDDKEHIQSLTNVSFKKGFT
jgi:hypothetical protein